MPYPVRYNETATTEIETAIGWYVIEIDRVLVLACMRHRQKPRSREHPLGAQ